MCRHSLKELNGTTNAIGIGGISHLESLHADRLGDVSIRPILKSCYSSTPQVRRLVGQQLLQVYHQGKLGAVARYHHKHAEIVQI